MSAVAFSNVGLQLDSSCNHILKQGFGLSVEATISREELIAHRFANHMPGVIRWERDAAAKGRPHATKYIVTLFDADEHGNHFWD